MFLCTGCYLSYLIVYDYYLYAASHQPEESARITLAYVFHNYAREVLLSLVTLYFGIVTLAVQYYSEGPTDNPLLPSSRYVHSCISECVLCFLLNNLSSLYFHPHLGF